MSGNLPEGWGEVSFGSLVTEVRNGVSPRPDLEPPGTPILRISAVRPGSVSLNDHRFLRNAGNLATIFAVHNRDLLFTRYNGSLDLLGVCGMVRGHNQGVLLYPDKLIRVRIDERVTSPEFVELYFQSPEARNAIIAAAKSSAGQQGISGASLKEQVVALPPLREQGRIVEKSEALLEQMKRAKARLDRVRLILKRFQHAVLAAACSGKLTEAWREKSQPICSFDGTTIPIVDLSEPPFVPEEWAIVPLSAVVHRFQYGTSEKADANQRSGVPVLRMGNIQEGRLDLHDLKFIKRNRTLDDFLLRSGDVLFNRTNSPELVGKTAVVESDEPMAFASYLIRVRVNPDVVRPSFVSWWLNSPWGRQWARQVRTDGVSQSNINASKLSAMPLPLPSLEEQDEILRIGSGLLALAHTTEVRVSSAAAAAETLTHAVLTKAFAGELVPTEAELARAEGRSYETAEELLARVRSTDGRGGADQTSRPDRTRRRRTSTGDQAPTA